MVCQVQLTAYFDTQVSVIHDQVQAFSIHVIRVLKGFLVMGNIHYMTLVCIKFNLPLGLLVT